MWMRTHAIHFLRRATTSRPSILNGNHCTTGTVITRHHSYSTGWSSNGDEETVSETSTITMTYAEAKKLMRLVNVKELKEKLGLMEGKEVISYDELLRASRSMGVANSVNEAAAFARVLDDAGVILVFRDKVYLQPDKIVDLVRKAVPLGLLHEDDTCKDELIKLQHEKEEIDVLAHKQVRRILWGGLVLTLSQIGLFFRLTFWEFSWDVMEPVAFFVTASGIVIGYAYFMITSRDPSYQDLLKRLFLSRERKLIQSRGFNIERFLELQKICGSPQDAVSNIKRRTGVDIKPEEILQSR